MSPVASLPPELLGLVFQYTQQTTPYARRVGLRPEIIFSHVSQSWRHIALSNSILWSKIAVDAYGCLPFLSLYLSRSGNCLLSIYLDTYSIDKQAMMAQIDNFSERVMRCIIPHIHRLQLLNIETRYGDTLRYILSFLEGKTAPHLASLSLDAHLGVAGIEGARPFPCHLPALRRLKAVNFASVFPTLTSVESIQFLSPESNVSAALFSVDTLRSICASSRALTALTIYTSCIQDNEASISPIELPSLRCLRVIGSMDADGADRILWGFDTPSLESLWLELPWFSINDPTALENAKPKFPSVRYLTLQTSSIPERIQIAHHFPSVTHIHFSYCWDMRGALDSLLGGAYDHPAPSDGRDTLLYPKLETVAFRCVRDTIQNFANRIYDTGVAFESATCRPLNLLADRGVYERLSATLPPGAQSVIHLQLLTESNFSDPWWKFVNEEYREKIFH